jgi:hypothetical protein
VQALFHFLILLSNQPFFIERITESKARRAWQGDDVNWGTIGDGSAHSMVAD